MRTLLRILGALFLVLLIVIIGIYAWASVSVNRRLSRTVASHSVEFPIPFPLDPGDPDGQGLGEAEQAALALTRARERGRHLVASRYACGECHGENFAGGVMVDAFPIGTLLGPNLTAGQGSRTTGFTAADWDRIVRHGIRRDGRPAAMPSEDFQLMSDQELSDIVSYIQSMPPVDNVVAEPSLGPLGKILMATGQMHLSVDLIATHDAPHARYPPETAATLEFGRHLAGVCTGCHRQDFSGGPITGGDPSWAPARNLTPHPDALGGWTVEQFTRTMREGRRPDGTQLLSPMTLVMPYAQQMADVELEALWMYLQSVPPVPPAGR